MKPASATVDNQGEGGAEFILSAGQLVMRYRSLARPALDNISISIRSGEIFGLLGPNGAGKTTAISIMSTLLRPTSGSVIICGVDILRHPAAARQLIGLVPQDIALYPEFTAFENLQFFGRLYGLRGSILKERVAESLSFVGLEQRADQRLFAFSGGMKRRINLAIGILNHPRLLFLDEPTVGIDAQSRNMILERLQELNKNGMTMIYTTHYMEEAERLCNRVAIIDEGRVIVCGPPGALVSRNSDCLDLQELFFRLTGKKLRDG